MFISSYPLLCIYLFLSSDSHCIHEVNFTRAPDMVYFVIIVNLRETKLSIFKVVCIFSEFADSFSNHPQKYILVLVIEFVLHELAVNKVFVKSV